MEEMKLALKSQEYRDTAKRFYKDKFEETIKPYKDLIIQVMKANKIGAFEALLKISKTHAYEASGMAQLLFIASAVEIAESKSNPE